MWAGILVSSCTEDGTDDSNLLFIRLLAQLGAVEVRVLDHLCRTPDKRRSPLGFVEVDWVFMQEPEVQELCRTCGCSDLQRLDRELDHLQALGLTVGGLVDGSPRAFVRIKASGLGFQLYVRCQGSRTTPAEFFGV